MRWKLQDYLERHDLNAHRLVKASGLSSNTVYPMTRGEAQRVSLATLETVLLALRDLTGEPVDVGDLLELEDTPASSAPWRTLAGLFDLPATPTDGAANHDRYIDEALAEEHEESLQGNAWRQPSRNSPPWKHFPTRTTRRSESETRGLRLGFEALRIKKVLYLCWHQFGQRFSRLEARKRTLVSRVDCSTLIHTRLHAGILMGAFQNWQASAR